MHPSPRPPASSDAPPGMVGDSPPMRHLVAQVYAFAAMPWPAVIVGETGSGKEAVARALHALSPRAEAPLVAINCAAVPDALAESTFFGHERGAFTGAERRREGLLERVGCGTLFLDEIGELSLRIQAKLLRVLQDGTFQRVGGDADLRFKGRVVAATHQALDTDAEAFRGDLYHRLSTFVLRVPTLRERRGDIPDLAVHLLARACRELPGAPSLRLDPDAAASLTDRQWPGNVRELENVLRGGVALALAYGDTVVRSAHLALCESAPVAPGPGELGEVGGLGLLAATDAFQRRMVEDVVAANAGNKTRAAHQLGVSRQWLHGLLNRWEGARRPAPRRVSAQGRMTA